MNNFVIRVKTLKNSKAIFRLYNENGIIIQTNAFIGKNGSTRNKVEGDGKTPKGVFKLGIVFGTHKSINNPKIKYIQINENLYWVDDIKSKYYNKLVDIRNVDKDWNSAEHLIEYLNQYEYAIEIKANPKNIAGNGSAIFLHCSVGKPTAGCVAIEKEKMLQVLKSIKENDLISIE